MSDLLHLIRFATGRAASGPLAGDIQRPVFERVAAQSPFPPGADLDGYVTRFRAELEALTGRVYGPLDPDDAVSQVIALIDAATWSTEPPRHQDTKGTGRRGDGGTGGEDAGNDDVGRGPVPLTRDSPGPAGNQRPLTTRAIPGYLHPGHPPSDVVAGLRAGHPEDVDPRFRGDDVEGAQSSALSPQSSPRVLAWDPAEIDCPGLAEWLRAASIELVPGDVPNDAGHQRVLQGLAELKVGLSGAVAGLADTGSIVVASGPGRARAASLLPLVHIAVLPISRLYPTMHDWLTAGGAQLVGESANVNVITGSSRTSDIELQLTLGMHGPKELHVVLVR